MRGILIFFPWQDYRELAAHHYDALYDFNRSGSREGKEPDGSDESVESKEEAGLRLPAGRATVDGNVPVLYEPEFRTPSVQAMNPLSVAPGVVPSRSDGRNPKCFSALFKGFVGASLEEFSPEPENVHLLLTSNLSFARACGFVPKGGTGRNMGTGSF